VDHSFYQHVSLLLSLFLNRNISLRFNNLRLQGLKSRRTFPLWLVNSVNCSDGAAANQTGAAAGHGSGQDQGEHCRGTVHSHMQNKKNFLENYKMINVNFRSFNRMWRMRQKILSVLGLQRF